jgi:putative transposase
MRQIDMHGSSKYHRRSIRLKDYDYHQAGAYFVTICTQNRICILDDPIVRGIVQDVWQALPTWFPTIALDEFVVMPNHIHFIVWVGVSLADAPLADAPLADAPETRTGASPVPTGWKIPKPEIVNPAPTLGDVVGAFKSLVFKVYLEWIKSYDPGRRAKFWQKNYYEHIIRDDFELNRIRQYIEANPIRWVSDRDNLENKRRLPAPVCMGDYLQEIREIAEDK